MKGRVNRKLAKGLPNRETKFQEMSIAFLLLVVIVYDHC